MKYKPRNSSTLANWLSLVVSVVLLILSLQYISHLIHVNSPQLDDRKIFKSYHNNNINGWIKPNLYKVGDKVQITTNKALPDDPAVSQPALCYYDLPFVCPPSDTKRPIHNSLTELFNGDYLSESDYILEFAKDEPCHILCSRKTSKKGMQRAYDLIKNDYIVQWYVDNDLPVGTTYISNKVNKKQYLPGFSLGYFDNQTGQAYLNTHLMFVVRYHAVTSDTFTIVGLEVYPRSIVDYNCPGASKDFIPLEVKVPENNDDPTYLPFSYSVYWREEFDLPWNQRWDLFKTADELLREKDLSFHWYSLINSNSITVGVITFLCLVISMNRMRILYNKSWKKRQLSITTTTTTRYPNIFTICITSGIQFFFLLISSVLITFQISKFHQIKDTIIVALFFIAFGIIVSVFIGTLIQRTFILTNFPDKYYLTNPILFGSTLPAFILLSMFIINSIIYLSEKNHAFPFKLSMYFFTSYFILSIPLSIISGVLSTRFISFPKYPSRSLPTSPNLNLDFEKTSSTSSSSSLSKYSMKYRVAMILLYLSLTGLIPSIILYLEISLIINSVWNLNSNIYQLLIVILISSQILCIIITSISYLINSQFIFRNTNTNTTTTNPLTNNNNANNSNNNNNNNNKISWQWRSFFIGASPFIFIEFYIFYFVFGIKVITVSATQIASIYYFTLLNVLFSLMLGSISYMVNRCLFAINYNNNNNNYLHLND
ncbi:hypothetical protein TBLA_0I00330 [Henningerozyma blattae CBS 6284]|uniref:Transmembrane 9 superfamily member n=1 Tax=Henningerozyma blattae (strain ATCC 34711 / CBS 6284 / DSM 70876 / NBRC 10599 / NRRL Y-10934 / UCD 77-7) TaxID=1071380 RepID=I2H8J5_HENB6|nr:hypothetical protein TBLA_0I00330 [Tetrapisispora blattae CBS 6284]CCH62697.1 hypothetical protein TBLA_0I00330 [Tetrapisispora blattae CBS 6284]